MMRNILTKLVVLAAVAQLPLGAWAEDDARLKALAAEKAALDAQAARDTAEAAAIKAAVDLAKTKASASDADTNTLQAKAARDQAETAALNAAKALADAKAAANNQDTQSQKAQLDAEAALTTSRVTAQTAELAALKTMFGTAPSVGSDGNVAITDSTTGMLLESKSGSLKATGVLAGKLCEVLKQRGISGAFVAPPDLERKMLASSFVLREFRDLSVVANNTTNKDLVGGTVTAQIAPAAILSAVTLMQYGAGAVQSIAKLFRSDYAIAVADGRRETWLEYFMAASCPQQVPRADIEAAVRAQGFQGELRQLNQLAAFVDAATAQKALQARKLERANANIKAQKDAKKEPTQGDIDDADAAQSQLDALARLDGPVARMKAVVDLVAGKPDAFIDAIVWDRFASADYKSKPRITVAFTTQDGQVTKTNWLTGKHVYGRSSGELIYRVVNGDGTVALAGYLLATNSDGELNFKASAPPSADGQQFLSSGSP